MFSGYLTPLPPILKEVEATLFQPLSESPPNRKDPISLAIVTKVLPRVLGIPGGGLPMTAPAREHWLPTLVPLLHPQSWTSDPETSEGWGRDQLCLFSTAEHTLFLPRS